MALRIYNASRELQAFREELAFVSQLISVIDALPANVQKNPCLFHSLHHTKTIVTKAENLVNQRLLHKTTPTQVRLAWIRYGSKIKESSLRLEAARKKIQEAICVTNLYVAPIFPNYSTLGSD